MLAPQAPLGGGMLAPQAPLGGLVPAPRTLPGTSGTRTADEALRDRGTGAPQLAEGAVEGPGAQPHQPAAGVVRDLAEVDLAVDVVEVDARELEIGAEPLGQLDHLGVVRRLGGQ